MWVMHSYFDCCAYLNKYYRSQCKLWLNWLISVLYHKQQNMYHLFLPFLFTLISNDYMHAFASQSVPRTPDTTASQNSAHHGRGPALAPHFSQSGPQMSSRPASASSEGGGKSGSKHMLRVGKQHQPPTGAGETWLPLVTLFTLPAHLEDSHPWFGGSLPLRISSWLSNIQLWGKMK